MARSPTESASLREVIEATPGVLPGGTPEWRIVEFNNVPSFGETITTTPRNPVSQTRGRRKGSITDSDSGVEVETDLTIEPLRRFGESFMFAEYRNLEFNLRTTGGVLPPPAVASGGVFTIATAGATLAGKMQWSSGSIATLVYAKGYTNAVNNGLHALAADVGSSDTSVDVGTALVDETPPANATLEVCGIRVLDDADLTLTVSGSTATLVSAAAISDWSTLGLAAGMFIHIGSATAAGVVQLALGAGGTTSYGYARITSISGATLNLDKLSSTLSTAAGPAAASQDVMFGRFLRNVAVTADATDNRYLERTHQFEMTWTDLDSVGTDQYEYVIGCYANTIELGLPLTSLASLTIGFLALSADDITSSRKTGASGGLSPLRTTAFSTAVDMHSIVVSVSGGSAISDICFKDLTATIANSLTPEKCLGTRGPSFITPGSFLVDLDGSMMFTDDAIIAAMRNNTTVTFHTILRNADGGIALDVPSLTLSGGDREFVRNESVTVSLTGASFTDPTLGYDVGISFFPFVPYA